MAFTCLLNDNDMEMTLFMIIDLSEESMQGSHPVRYMAYEDEVISSSFKIVLLIVFTELTIIIDAFILPGWTHPIHVHPEHLTTCTCLTTTLRIPVSHFFLFGDICTVKFQKLMKHWKIHQAEPIMCFLAGNAYIAFFFLVTFVLLSSKITEMPKIWAGWTDSVLPHAMFTNLPIAAV